MVAEEKRHPAQEMMAAFITVIGAIPRTTDYRCALCDASMFEHHEATCPIHVLGWGITEVLGSGAVPQEREPRPQKVLIIDRQRFVEMLRSHGHYAFYVDDLPADAHLIGVDPVPHPEDFETNHPVRLIFQSRAWPSVYPENRGRLWLTGYYHAEVS